ncbi:Endonuclease/exonuclease/phosphatase domain-containing protein [Rozella allomycis CSF55]|uniref:poly(A)-specific ribonuclease n=1 Tax=Rozella allomycis (strain CSF55) TaxID=988480 RepID=A0A075AVB0_ROZAC|nr:Endonuclease/exonuclease/phosphatase domain-containing protein [Rozella allomycis CSF55]|eukprot:EPZ32627.1 Endonuclease/exonuclease/phosphatase domain-containing protein [Rozella allomycis CSF55]
MDSERDYALPAASAGIALMDQGSIPFKSYNHSGNSHKPVNIALFNHSSATISLSTLPNSFLSQLPATPHYRARLAATSTRTGTNGSVSMLTETIFKNEKSESTENSLSQSWTTLDLSGMMCRNVSNFLFKYSFLTCLYLNHNSLTFIPGDIGRLNSLNVLDLSGNQLKALPPEIGHLTNLKDLLLFDNLLSTLPFEMGTLYQLEFLGLEGNHLSDPISSLYQKQGTQSLIAFLRDHAPDTIQPIEREWIVLESETDPSQVFTCLSYNILFETAQFEEFFVVQLSLHGYSGIFHPKSRARTMSDQDKRTVDGCAIFFKQKPDRKTDDMYNRVMTKDNIALFAALEYKAMNERLIVGNCHIHWDPLHKDVKLVQTAIMIEELELFYKKFPNSAIALCGDFNSLPSSGVYRFLSTGSIENTHEDFGDFTYIPYTTEGVKHLLPLQSAYESALKSELPFTNFTPNFTGVLDYIWFSHKTLTVSAVLSGISEDYASKIVGFPNMHFPSDHIAIMVEFKWKTSKPSFSKSIKR